MENRAPVGIFYVFYIIVFAGGFPYQFAPELSLSFVNLVKIQTKT